MFPVLSFILVASSFVFAQKLGSDLGDRHNGSTELVGKRVEEFRELLPYRIEAPELTEENVPFSGKVGG